MTVDELYENWQGYIISVDVNYLRRVRGYILLKEKFFACFKIEKENALLFDPGGHSPVCFILRPDEENNCIMKMPSGKWVKIGKFVKIKNPA